MRIYLAQHAGFCFGVKRAVDLAEQVLSENSDRAFTIGEIIHNPQTVQRLSGAGLRTVSGVDEIPGGVLIIRSHGLPPELVASARGRGLALVDATCPYVRRAQTLAARLTEDGYDVVIVGDRSHPEVEALLAHTGYSATVIAVPDELNGVPFEKPVAVIAQTTQPVANVQACVDRLRSMGHQPVLKKTTCSATEMRQAEAADMARSYGTMVVIGGRKSANTTKLAKICTEAGARTYHVESATELEPEWFTGVESVGVTAGASTPDWIIKEVVDRMTDFEGNIVETENDQRAELAPEGPSPNEMDEAIARISPGAKLRGRVTKVEADQVYVDIGGKTDGVIPLREVSHRTLSSASEAVALGDEIDVVVLRSENDKGEPVLSKRRADAEAAWERVSKAHQDGTVINAKVVERVKGGLVVDIGLRGFIPGSQVSREYLADLESLVGKELPCRVMELDEAKHAAVLSHRSVEEEEAKTRREALMEKIKPGEIVTGTVKRLTSFGAFVDVGGVEGLLHISELAWGRVQQPSDVVKEGDEVKVKVLRVEPDTGKIALSLRQAAPDPWQKAQGRFHEGQVVEGEVVRVVDFGAFVRLEEGIEGLVHISQLAEERVAKASDVVKPGDRIQVKVLSFDPAQKRVSLSRKQALPPAPKRETPARAPREREEVPTLPEAPPVTLGDMFGALFEERLKDKGNK